MNVCQRSCLQIATSSRKVLWKQLVLPTVPIRDHKVVLVIRRRRWTDLRTDKSFSMPFNLDVVCKGTRYSKEFGAFFKKCMETSPVTCRTLEEYYHINAHTFEKLYKETLSGFRD